MKKLLSRIQLLLILFTFFSCQVNENPCKLPETVLKDIDKIDSLTKQPEVRERDRTWNLSNYQEPSLMSAQYETYRFIWHSSFDGINIYRVEKINGTYKAIAKTFRDQDSVPRVREFSISSK
jgi:hypothetical protein